MSTISSIVERARVYAHGLIGRMVVTDSIIKLLIWILNEDQTLVSLSNSITTHRSINYVLDNISNFCFFNACNSEVGGASLFFSNVLVLLSDFSSSSFSPCPSLLEGMDSSEFLAAFLFQNTQPDLQLSFNRVV